MLCVIKITKSLQSCNVLLVVWLRKNLSADKLLLTMDGNSHQVRFNLTTNICIQEHVPVLLFSIKRWHLILFSYEHKRKFIKLFDIRTFAVYMLSLTCSNQEYAR